MGFVTGWGLLHVPTTMGLSLETWPPSSKFGVHFVTWHQLT